MFSSPASREIDHRTIKLMVGVIAITLANVTSFFSGEKIQSISASYYEGDWARNILVGFLFAIAAYMLAYNGEGRREMFLAKAVALAALGGAMFPCDCGKGSEIIPHVHYISAAVMFSLLVIFCWIFYKRATQKGHREALRRAKVYAFCGVVIVASMLIMAIDYFTHDALTAIVSRLTFYCERAGLVAFGISWLSASHILPVISSQQERFSPFN